LELDETIIKRIEKVEEALRRLKEIRKIPLSMFLNDWKTQDAALRNFQVAIEGCLDIGNHIVALIGKKIPTTYIEIIEILVEENILAKNFSKIAKNMVKFRNLIIHEYLYLDLEKVYSILQKIDDMSKLLRYLTEYYTKDYDS